MKEAAVMRSAAVASAVTCCCLLLVVIRASAEPGPHDDRQPRGNEPRYSASFCGTYDYYDPGAIGTVSDDVQATLYPLSSISAQFWAIMETATSSYANDTLRGPTHGTYVGGTVSADTIHLDQAVDPVTAVSACCAWSSYSRGVAQILLETASGAVLTLGATGCVRVEGYEDWVTVPAGYILGGIETTHTEAVPGLNSIVFVFAEASSILTGERHLLPPSPPPPSPPSPPYEVAPLPADLQPEVAYFDALTGVTLSLEPNNKNVISWADAGSSNATATNELLFTGSCRHETDKDVVSIAFDGSSCLAVNSRDLPSTWDSSPTGAFTAIWIGMLVGPTGRSQALMSLGRQPSDQDRTFFWWGTVERAIISNGVAAYSVRYYWGDQNAPEMTLPPSGRWILEAFVRQPGATKVSYYRYGNDGPLMQSWRATSEPGQIQPDSFAIGGDPQSGTSFLNGKTAVVLLYNRALSEESMFKLASVYAPRFRWSTPQPRMKPPSPPPSPTNPPGELSYSYSTPFCGLGSSLGFNSVGTYTVSDNVQATLYPLSSISALFGAIIMNAATSFYAEGALRGPTHGTYAGGTVTGTIHLDQAVDPVTAVSACCAISAWEYAFGVKTILLETASGAVLSLGVEDCTSAEDWVPIPPGYVLGGMETLHLKPASHLVTIKYIFVDASILTEPKHLPPGQPPMSPSEGFAPLPEALQPEVAYFDASTGLIEAGGGVQRWADAGSSSAATTATNVLTLVGSCRLNTDGMDTAAIAFDGSTCMAISNQDLPSTWDTSPTGAFTAIWIGMFNGDTSYNQVLMTLSLSLSDRDEAFAWGTTERQIYSRNAGGDAYWAKQGSEPEVVLPPSGRWTLEAFVRQPGAESVSYYRYGSDGPLIESWQAASIPSAIGPDTLTIGADPRDGDKFLDGKVSVVLLYNRALSEESMLDVASFYAPRFKWSTPQQRLNKPPPPSLPPSALPLPTNTTKTFRCKPGIALWGTNLPRTPVKLSNRASNTNNTAECQRLCAHNPGCKGYYYKTTTWCYLLGEVKAWGKKYSTAVQACKVE